MDLLVLQENQVKKEKWAKWDLLALQAEEVAPETKVQKETWECQVYPEIQEKQVLKESKVCLSEFSKNIHLKFSLIFLGDQGRDGEDGQKGVEGPRGNPGSYN
jgi:hypothetical protein